MGWLFWLIFNKIYLSPVLLTFYKALKHVYRLGTETTEIYRVCLAASYPQVNDKGNGESLPVPVSNDVVYRIDRAILFSKQLVLERRQLESAECSVDELTRSILTKKRFPAEGGQTLSPAALVLRTCLSRIAETYQLGSNIKDRTLVKYDSANTEHEEKLYELWKALMPDTKLESRLTSQWEKIGFQGNDPATDFRGMGLQGLDDLLYYVHTHPDSVQHTFSCSRDPIAWYPYAIVGINLTQFAVQTLHQRRLQQYLYDYGATKEGFGEFYCYLYHHFNAFWTSHRQPPLTVMDFEQSFKIFKKRMEWQLLIQGVEPLRFTRHDSSQEIKEEKKTA